MKKGSNNLNLAEAGAKLMGGQLKSHKALAGGCVSDCLQITLADGREVVVKNGPAPKVEADMLRAVKASGAPAPAVFGANDQALVIELLAVEGDLGSSKSWSSLGQALAKLHSASGERYGWADDYAFSTFAFSNGWTDNWPSFWAERRLLPHVEHVPKEIGRRIQKLCELLPSRLPAKPRPALLHGDLWAGNVLVRDGQISGLIDPACYYGHYEVDFATLNFTTLNKTSQHFYDAYGPLEEGFQERQPIYQLWPALVHLRLFGGGTMSIVEELLTKAGRLWHAKLYRTQKAKSTLLRCLWPHGRGLPTKAPNLPTLACTCPPPSVWKQLQVHSGGIAHGSGCLTLMDVDFGMLTLFGTPSKHFYDAYGPMEDGFQQRQPIYQLWPALVHLRLFGSGYKSMVEELLAKAGV